MPRPSHKIVVLIGFVLLFYLVIGFAVIHFSAKFITQEYYELIGTKAKDIAVITANKLKLTDADVDELKKLSFDQLSSHPVNRFFTSFFDNRGKASDIKYAYIMFRLPPEEIKYYVIEENSDFYGLLVGTPLDTVWLLDVILGEKEKQAAQNETDYYRDENRYSFLRTDAGLRLYEKQEAGYSIVEDEWGRYVSGLAPVYTAEGNFSGLLGIDIYAENLNTYRSRIFSIALFLFIIPSLILFLLLMIVYANYVKVYRRSSITDELSKLHNRAYLSYIVPVLLRNCVRQKIPLAVIMLDIDYFKNYNDFYGHQSGDAVIEKIGKMLGSSTLRSSDVAARYGGEEFLLIFQGVSTEGAVAAAGRVRDGLLELKIPHEKSSCSSLITVSQGIYSAIPDAATEQVWQEFIKKADTALYEAKKTGRNCHKIAAAE